MQRTLNSRVERLEQTAAKEQPTQTPADWDPEQTALTVESLRKIIALSYEPDDREEVLTLEERLAIARKDAAPKPEEWKDLWDPQLGRLRNQLVPVDHGPAEAARELEILILERDGKIDRDVARMLRENNDRLGDKPSAGAKLMELPFPVVIEKEVALAEEALRKCPLRASLPLERQLELAKADKEADRRRYEADKEANGADGVHWGLAPITDAYNDWKIGDLEQKIKERDRRR